jgi:hypothetical protein
VKIAKLLKSAVAASAVATLCGVASAQTYGADSISLHGREGSNIEARQGGDGKGEDCNVIWDNGLPDNVKAVRSAEAPNGMHSWYAADDFVLYPCRWNYIESIELYMAIGTDVVDPVVDLRLYADCDGIPDKPDYTTFAGEIGLGVPSVAFAGYNEHKITFHLDWWVFGNEDGCDRYWIVPVGRTNNTKYFWISTNVGPNDKRVQGVQAHFKSPTTVPAYTEWTPYDDYNGGCTGFPECEGDCLDFNFRICGKICALLKDQSNYDLDGEAATKFPNVNDTGMSVDNFQIPPGQGKNEICRIEAWLATNCNPNLVYGLLFENFCDKPGDQITSLGFVDFYEATGETFDGLPVYKFVWFCTGIKLDKGRNYWFAPLASRGLNIGERSVWLFRERLEDCKDIWITEGCYINWNDDYPKFRPVSYFTPMNVPYDFAFKIWLVDDTAGNSVPQGDPGDTFDPADIDQDGVVGLSDLQLLLFRFGTTTN